ncbi:MULTISPECIES: hypothetical protein [unclassified Mesorhizobium]|uniref:hypothetical protein n=1 Tax=unclassified Mesorhizobium TaxID=325217 RepID=UPI001126FE3E|nr:MULTISPECIES: hypothetical protein [unclassified Mesorhizobium]TPL03123.1 hypothetical protein FJ567_07710 [Mesorhizobium sp. B2-4-16]TPL73889.1 hypothetical protein FJ956_09395 [Mesorhizobium sp. B2-4-3]
MAEKTDSLESETILVGDLGNGDRDEMFRLYETYYDATDRGRFERDLSEKNAVVVIRRKSGIVGFSTLSVGSLIVDGETVHYLFSGDTVLDSSRWGDPVLLRAWFRAAGAVKAELGEARLFWFSIMMGHRTFRILPNFFREFVPAIDGKDRSDLRLIRNRIAAARYGCFFDAASGLIDFGQSQGHLRREWAGVEETAERNRFAAFFLKANPAYFRGVELACLAEFHPLNLKRYGATSFAEGLSGGR